MNALGKHFSPLFGRSLDPLSEISTGEHLSSIHAFMRSLLATTTGATQGIFATMQAVINPGEEAIVIEPFYDRCLAKLFFLLSRVTLLSTIQLPA